MTAFINIILLLSGPQHNKVYVDVCSEPLDHLNLDQKIEMSIGCSVVDGKRAYRNRNLKRIYFDDAYFSK